MKALIVFNHPAPYKVKLFDELAKKIDLFVIFERKSAKDRPTTFYSENDFKFKNICFKKGYVGKENSFTFELKKYIKKNYKNYDLIIMNGYSTISEQIAINYMIKNHIPYVLFINGGVIKEKESFIKRNLKKRYISNAVGYFSPNKQANMFLEYYGAKKPICVYPYSTYFEKDICDSNLTQENRKALRNKYQLPEGKLIISASNFIPRKNNIELFDAVKGEKCSLVLYGNGPLREQYFEYLKQNSITNVIIKDFVPNKELIDIMSCCDAFITLSKEDIYGHTTLEALAAGLPVISSTNVVSSLSVIENGINGFLVSSKEEIKNALNKVDYDLMSLNCINTAKQYTIEKEVKAIVEGMKGFKK